MLVLRGSLSKRPRKAAPKWEGLRSKWFELSGSCFGQKQFTTSSASMSYRKFKARVDPLGIAWHIGLNWVAIKTMTWKWKEISQADQACCFGVTWWSTTESSVTPRVDTQLHISWASGIVVLHPSSPTCVTHAVSFSTSQGIESTHPALASPDKYYSNPWMQPKKNHQLTDQPWPFPIVSKDPR